MANDNDTNSNNNNNNNSIATTVESIDREKRRKEKKKEPKKEEHADSQSGVHQKQMYKMRWREWRAGCRYLRSFSLLFSSYPFLLFRQRTCALRSDL